MKINYEQIRELYMNTKQRLKFENENPKYTDLETTTAYIKDIETTKDYITALEIHIDLLHKLIKSKDEELKRLKACSN
jgi:hypothetical protein